MSFVGRLLPTWQPDGYGDTQGRTNWWQQVNNNREGGGARAQVKNTLSRTQMTMHWLPILMSGGNQDAVM